jgi:hypothetical protein
MPALPPYVLPLLYGLGSLLVAFMGRHRKWGFWGYFWASIVMSPVLGLLFVLAGDKPQWRPKSAAPTPTPAPAPRPAAPAAAAQARAASVPAAPSSPSSTS